MLSNPILSIIVCHHQGNLIDDFVKSLSNLIIKQYELIVVSDSYTPTNSLNGRLHIIPSNDLPAKKRNLGVAYSHAPYIAFFDDDVEITNGCIEDMISLLLNNRVGMVYGKLHKFGTSRFDEAGGFLTWNGFIWSRAEQNIPDTGQYDVEETIFSGKSASCMIRKSVFNEVGGFDEDFGILGEESDLAWRVWLKGYKVVYCPKSLAYHKFNTPLKPFNKFYSHERVHTFGCRNYLTMLTKNLGKEHLWILPIHFTIWFTVALAMIITMKLSQGTHILRGLSQYLSRLSGTLKKRKLIQSTRIVDEYTIWKSIYRKTHGAYYWTRFCRYIGLGIHG